MKKVLFLTALTITAMATSSVLAAGVAVVNVQDIMENSEASKKAQTELKKETEKGQKKVDEIEASLKKRHDELRSKEGVWSKEKLAQEQASFAEAMREYRMKTQKIQRDIDVKTAQFRREIGETITEISKEVAKEKGFDMVLGKSIVIYHTDATDITKTVLERLNKRMK